MEGQRLLSINELEKAYKTVRIVFHEFRYYFIWLKLFFVFVLFAYSGLGS